MMYRHYSQITDAALYEAIEYQDRRGLANGHTFSGARLAPDGWAVTFNGVLSESEIKEFLVRCEDERYFPHVTLANLDAITIEAFEDYFVHGTNNRHTTICPNI